ncbi:hypothetical protein B0J17DRAFT_246320 [Rhizoctonia solani]|nr:hypothetical protein B0J17DRAFT_246320 [Rhizoctonia solani]
MMHTQSMAVSSPTTGLNLASTRELQEVMTQSTLGNTSAPNFDTVNYSDRDPIHYPTYTHHSPERSSFNRSLLDCCQPSASSNRSSHYDTHRSRNPPASIAGNEFQSTSVVVPVPRRSFNFGAFLTPDPPYQTPNIDLPRRPGTSPPQQSSVPNGRCLLAPNTGRRQSEVTWQSYGSQFDRVQFPPVPSCNPRSRNDIPEKHTHAPPISAAPQTQPSVQAQDPREDICAIATYGSISTQSIDSRPLPISACPPQFLIQRPSDSAIREGLGVRRPGESHGCTPTSSTLRRKRSVQQYHTRQNKSNPAKCPRSQKSILNQRHQQLRAKTQRRR